MVERGTAETIRSCPYSRKMVICIMLRRLSDAKKSETKHKRKEKNQAGRKEQKDQ